GGGSRNHSSEYASSEQRRKPCSTARPASSSRYESGATAPVGLCGEQSQKSASSSQRSNASRSGSQPSDSRSGIESAAPPANSAPRSYTGYAGSGIAATRRSPNATCGNEK